MTGTGTYPYSVVWNYVPRSGIDYDESNLYKALNYIREDQDINEIKDIGEGTFDNVSAQIDRMVDIALDQYRLLLEFLQAWSGNNVSIDYDPADTNSRRAGLPELDWSPYIVADVPVDITVPDDISPVEQEAVETPEYPTAPSFDAIGQYPELDFGGAGRVAGV